MLSSRGLVAKLCLGLAIGGSACGGSSSDASDELVTTTSEVTMTTVEASTTTIGATITTHRQTSPSTTPTTTRPVPSTTSRATTTTTARRPQWAYGDDDRLDDLWDDCDTGDMEACDGLFEDSPAGSEYEEFSDSCGERSLGGDGGSCVELMGRRNGDGSSTAQTSWQNTLPGVWIADLPWAGDEVWTLDPSGTAGSQHYAGGFGVSNPMNNGAPMPNFGGKVWHVEGNTLIVDGAATSSGRRTIELLGRTGSAIRVKENGYVFTWEPFTLR